MIHNPLLRPAISWHSWGGGGGGPVRFPIGNGWNFTGFWQPTPSPGWLVFLLEPEVQFQEDH